MRKKKDNPLDHYDVAAMFLADRYIDDNNLKITKENLRLYRQKLRLRWWESDFYYWDEGCYYRLKDSELKGKERFAEINKQAGLSEDQIEALKEIGKIRAKLQKDAIALLTDEQKQSLPERLQRTGKKRKGKKKKKAA